MTGQAASKGLTPVPLEIVSVQSQVVYGRVGNNVALPVFREHGLEAAAVPTVVLSNTPHYPTCHGGAMPLEWFSGYLNDLSARQALDHLRAVVAGFLGGPEQAGVLAEWVSAVQAQLPEANFIVDPVIGDHDHGVYVDPGMIEAYREHIVPLAQGLTPNGFELEHLTGLPVHTLDEVATAARSLLAYNDRLRWVIVTSAAPEGWPPGEMHVSVVTDTEIEVIRHRRLDVTPKGTGDLFSAELTARWLNGIPLAAAARGACERVLAALDYTAQANCAELLLPFTE